MPRYSHLSPQPYQLGQLQPGGAAVVALHGFTSSPGEMRFMAERLASQGHEVHGLLLPGHGTTEAELLTTTRHQWLAAVQAQVTALHHQGKRVVLMGQSLGGSLALRCAANNDAVVAVIAFAPALRMPWLASLAGLARPFMRTIAKHENERNDFVDKAQLQQLWSYDHTPLQTVAELAAMGKDAKAHLHQVRCPVLLYSAAHDAMITQASVAQAASLVAGPCHHTHLPNSGHIIPLDAAREQVAAELLPWLATNLAR